MWKATQAGNVLETTRSHSAMSSEVSLVWTMLARTISMGLGRRDRKHRHLSNCGQRLAGRRAESNEGTEAKQQDPQSDRVK